MKPAPGALHRRQVMGKPNAAAEYLDLDPAAGEAVADGAARASEKIVRIGAGLPADGELLQLNGQWRLAAPSTPAERVEEIDVEHPEIGFMQVLSFLAWPRKADEKYRVRDLKLAAANFWANGGGKIPRRESGYHKRDRVCAVERLWSRAGRTIESATIFAQPLTFASVARESGDKIEFSGPGSVRRVAARLATAGGFKSADTIRARRWNDLTRVAHLAAAVADSASAGRERRPLHALCRVCLSGDGGTLAALLASADRRRRLVNPMIGLSAARAIEFRPSKSN